MRLALIICTLLCFWDTEAREVNNTSFVNILVPVFCNATLLPSVDMDVQRVRAGCNITLRFPGRPNSQMWLRAVQSEGKKKEPIILKEALQQCRTSDMANNKKLRKYYGQMCYGFAPIDNVNILRRRARITGPGVLEITNLTMEDSGIYQARSGRQHKEFTLQIEKPRFILKVMNVTEGPEEPEPEGPEDQEESEEPEEREESGEPERRRE